VWRDRSASWTPDDARLAAHEMFHLYNGQIIERTSGSGSDAETYWFSEGFTEHYTDELMRRGGVWRARDWFEAVRDRLRRYHHHPDCETPNDKADMRWGGSAVQLPYLRGSMVAAYVDSAMRKSTGGAKNLDDFMRMLLSRARNHEPPLDPATMVQLITREAGEEIGGVVKAVALGGKRLSLAPDAFGSCVEVTGTGVDQDLAIKPGVDLEACLRSGR
jgi:predicted metalloprotease with PDZ domain